jgi:iron-sulfur cluster repair protein YtfE (RIC family)
MNAQNQYPCSPYVAHLKEEHREVHALVSGVRRQVEALTGADLPRQLPVVRRVLGDLRQRLARHFAEEEGGGCLEEAAARLPRLGAAVQQIENEHPRLLAQLDAVLDRVRGTLDAQAWPDVLVGFGDFARALAQHEALENRVLEQGFNEDLTNAT